MRVSSFSEAQARACTWVHMARLARDGTEERPLRGQGAELLGDAEVTAPRAAGRVNVVARVSEEGLEDPVVVRGEVHRVVGRVHARVGEALMRVVGVWGDERGRGTGRAGARHGAWDRMRSLREAEQGSCGGGSEEQRRDGAWASIRSEGSVGR